MKKISDVVYKETLYIAIVCSVLSLFMQSVFLILNKWNFSVLLGNLFGLFVAVMNFFAMAITVQLAVNKEEKEAKNTLRLSQNSRFVLLILFAVAAYYLPFVNTIAFIIPYLFPRIAIALHPILRKEKK